MLKKLDKIFEYSSSKYEKMMHLRVDIYGMFTFLYHLHNLQDNLCGFFGLFYKDQ